MQPSSTPQGIYCRSGCKGCPATPPPPAAPESPIYAVLTGNPNAGKTTVFNCLTGQRAHVGNYAGVTVERKEGELQNAPAHLPITILDLPGAYSLTAQSLDEQVARDVLLNRLGDVPAPAVVVIVVDAANLQRNLYFATQVIELGYRTIVALNMIDVAEDHGHIIDPVQLSRELGVPVIPLIASIGRGIAELRQAIIQQVCTKPALGVRQFYQTPAFLEQEIGKIVCLLEANGLSKPLARREALLVLGGKNPQSHSRFSSASIREAVVSAQRNLNRSGLDWRATLIEARYQKIAEIQRAVATESGTLRESFSDRLDRVVTHKLWGMIIFVFVMAAMFLSIFTLARAPMEWLENGVGLLGDTVARLIPPGDLQSLLVKGMIEGVGAVVVFLPQICLLFLFIGILEHSGYMARAAFLMDRLMSKVGLHGKSFIPMLTSFGCAIPGILAARTIESTKDRLLTIMIAPLMSCSARMPVYVLLLAACFPNNGLAAGITMFSMYLLGILAALGMAWVFKKTVLKGEASMLVMELPPYQKPLMQILARQVWERSKLFLRRAGTVILGINILLWFFVTYPKAGQSVVRGMPSPAQAMTESTNSREVAPDTLPTNLLSLDPSPPRSALEAREKELQRQEASSPHPSPSLGTEKEKTLALAGISASSSTSQNESSQNDIRGSFAGMVGRAIEPFISPLGFDWKIGIGLVTSFAAREVFVSTMAIIYKVDSGGDEDAERKELARAMREQVRPDGTPVYSTLTIISLLIFYVIALQCVSTVVVVWRETNTWKWAALQWVYMTGLAWICCFIVYQGGRLLGFQ